MRIEMRAASIGSGLAAEVAPLSLSADTGVVAVLAVEGDDRPLHVSLLIGGRLRPDAGQVLVDGADDRDELRRRSALVDTPVVAEPNDDLALRLVLSEELGFADRPSGRAAVSRYLDEHGLLAYGGQPLRALPTADRIRILANLALARAHVDALVITSPERHGGDPAAWFPAIATLADRATVIVVTDLPTARQLLALGARDATLPLEVELVSTESIAS
jgi:ABC-2 type transport system ATP-binding protein